MHKTPDIQTLRMLVNMFRFMDTPFSYAHVFLQRPDQAVVDGWRLMAGRKEYVKVTADVADAADATEWKRPYMS